MAKDKIQPPSDYFLTPEELQDLSDWALEAFARMEERSGRVVPLVRHEGTPFTTAKEAWDHRRRQRDAERRTS